MLNTYLVSLHSWCDPELYRTLPPWTLSLSLGLLTLLFEDIALIIGVAVIHQRAPLMVPIFLGLFVGIVSGDIILYVIGRWFNNIICIEHWIKRQNLNDKINALSRNFIPLLVMCRAIPASRLPTLLAAGFIKVKFLQFITIILVSCALWVGLILWGGASLVRSLNEVLGFPVGWLLLIVVLAWLLRNIVKQQKIIV